MTAALKYVYYPDDDGQPMSDNTWQFDWITLLQGGLDALFRDREDVFVAGNHLIYPVKGRNDVRQAPDVYVAFGAPREPRGSYKVWDENGVFPQVIFEVWSPGNRLSAMEDKRAFYERYGAEEFYIVYPERPAFLEAWRRDGGQLVRIPDPDGYVSPRLGVRFELGAGELVVRGPDGRPFLTPRDLVAARAEAEQKADEERARAAEAERHAADERERAARLAAKLRELGVDPDAV
jgi:Uma2 family endonuclease